MNIYVKWVEKDSKNGFIDRIIHGFVSLIDGVIQLLINPFGYHSNIYFNYIINNQIKHNSR